RKVKIENEKWSIGYDGEDVWLLQNEEDAYTGNARFYHTSMSFKYGSNICRIILGYIFGRSFFFKNGNLFYGSFSWVILTSYKAQG
ncbi:MAG: hypothetical protein AAFP76_17255, partial [Bacteroidota bacterium]